MDLQLQGKSAIITGSSRGLGLASAKALAAEGCRVCLCARGREALEQAASDVPNVNTGDGEWQDALDQTLFPAIRMSRLVVPHMRQHGGGCIIMIASIWGRESGGRMVYNAVKAAEISLAKAMAQQLAKDNIRVNSVAPGSILFPGGSWHKRQQADPAGIADFIARELPFGRFGRPDEVGAVVAFVASARASWISGACITVDGCQSRSNI